MTKVLNFAEYEHIKKDVVENFEYYEVKNTPINPFELARKIGISVVPYSSFEPGKRNVILKHCKDGVSLTFNGKYTIFYNDSIDNFKRIKQTIMHEIAHYLLGHSGLNKDEEEAEANFFAKYALAPPPLIHNMKCEINIKNIMKVFCISFEAATYALSYYHKWLNAGKDYTNYERKIINLFKEGA